MLNKIRKKQINTVLPSMENFLCQTIIYKGTSYEISREALKSMLKQNRVPESFI